MAEWSPEIAVDETLAHALLGDQFPELELGTLRLLGEGWDNTAWLVDERWVFRFPRRTIALPLVDRELAVLPALAPQLPLPVPEPVFVGKPGRSYPWPFLGARLVPGLELVEAELDDGGRAALAQPLGAFLRALHGAEVEVELPLDPNRRADMPFRARKAREALAELGWELSEADALLDRSARLPPPGPPVLCHGDLHLRHALVQGGRLTGVIDWGDVCRADPAIDLVLHWCALPPTARGGFLDAYGDVDEAALVRARVLAVHLCAMLALHARSEGLERVRHGALAGLERTLLG